MTYSLKRFRGGLGNRGRKSPGWNVYCSMRDCADRRAFSFDMSPRAGESDVYDYFTRLGWHIAEHSRGDLCPAHNPAFLSGPSDPPRARKDLGAFAAAYDAAVRSKAPPPKADVQPSPPPRIEAEPPQAVEVESPPPPNVPKMSPLNVLGPSITKMFHNALMYLYSDRMDAAARQVQEIKKLVVKHGLRPSEVGLCELVEPPPKADGPAAGGELASITDAIDAILEKQARHSEKLDALAGACEDIIEVQATHEALLKGGLVRLERLLESRPGAAAHREERVAPELKEPETSDDIAANNREWLAKWKKQMFPDAAA